MEGAGAGRSDCLVVGIYIYIYTYIVGKLQYTLHPTASLQTGCDHGARTALRKRQEHTQQLSIQSTQKTYTY